MSTVNPAELPDSNIFSDIRLSETTPPPEASVQQEPAPQHQGVDFGEMTLDTARTQASPSLVVQPSPVMQTELLSRQPMDRHEAAYLREMEGALAFRSTLDSSVTGQRLNIARSAETLSREFSEIEARMRRELSEGISTGLTLTNIERDGIQTAETLEVKAGRRLELGRELDSAEAKVAELEGELRTAQTSLTHYRAEYDVHYTKLKGVKDYIRGEHEKLDRALAARQRRYTTLDAGNFKDQSEMIKDHDNPDMEHSNPYAISKEEFELLVGPGQWDIYKGHPDNIRHIVRERLFVTPEVQAGFDAAKAKISEQQKPTKDALTDRLNDVNEQISALRTEEHTVRFNLQAAQSARNAIFMQIDSLNQEILGEQIAATETVQRAERTKTIPTESFLLRAAAEELRRQISSRQELADAASGREVTGPVRDLARHVLEVEGGAVPQPRQLTDGRNREQPRENSRSHILSRFVTRVRFTLDN